MRVLIIGSGGREHALAWKISQSARLQKLYVCPGNPGTAGLGEQVEFALDATGPLVDFARSQEIDLVVIGPEQVLAAGLSDALRAAGIAVFGPSQAAARIETSKAFSKDFMRRHGIPTARFAVFDSVTAAHQYVDQVEYPLVIKASGLAAGKGVLLPGSKEEAHSILHSLMVEGAFGAAAEQVIIEERLSGEEVSLLAFCDGSTVKAMPPAQDHKRLRDADAGPNTGGMGAYAPVSIFPPSEVEKAVEAILQPVIDGLREEGLPYIGVLYAGLMLTASGPQVLEFNARFGDPETQVILPLLETDLLDVLQACVEGRLAEQAVCWKASSSACVVMASAGYPEKPEKGKTICFPEQVELDIALFQAGTCLEKGELTTAGGRVLGVTAWADDLPDALEKAYRVAEQIGFEGAYYRRDIGFRELARLGKPAANDRYCSAGVDIDAGSKAVALMSAAVHSTYNANVLAGIGSFGGLYDAASLKAMQSPVLVASTDGVGTKVKLAAQLSSMETVGEDIVNHCTNDILVQGARPLFFLDYYASSRLKPEAVAAVVSGIAKACRENEAVLLGGETAEMPGVYAAGEFDVAGTIVGVLERRNLLPRTTMAEGDLLVGFRSSGPHTNGYSLIRQIFEGSDFLTYRPELGSSLRDALLAPHRSYLNLLIGLIEQYGSPIQALAHLTGGAFIENIPRVLPDGLGARIQPGSWPVPPLFQLIQRAGNLQQTEMHRVFNMGIGMVAVVAADRLDEVKQHVQEECWVIGSLVKDPSRKVVLAS